MHDVKRSDRRPLFIALCSVLAFAGCTDDGGDAADGMDSAGDTTGDGPGFDEQEVIAQAADYAASLTKVNDQATSSAHGLADTVNFYVSPSSLQAYLMFDPEMPQEVALPEGTLLVKEHFNPEGATDGFLMMYKAPAGYNPDAADWFWARVDGAGNTQETGVVGFCVGCHNQVADAGFVFGVPLDNRL